MILMHLNKWQTCWTDAVYYPEWCTRWRQHTKIRHHRNHHCTDNCNFREYSDTLHFHHRVSICIRWRFRIQNRHHWSIYIHMNHITFIDIVAIDTIFVIIARGVIVIALIYISTSEAVTFITNVASATVRAFGIWATCIFITWMITCWVYSVNFRGPYTFADRLVTVQRGLQFQEIYW